MSNYKRKEVFDYLTRKPVTTQDIELARSRIQTPVPSQQMPVASNEDLGFATDERIGFKFAGLVKKFTKKEIDSPITGEAAKLKGNDLMEWIKEQYNSKNYNDINFYKAIEKYKNEELGGNLFRFWEESGLSRNNIEKSLARKRDFKFTTLGQGLKSEITKNIDTPFDTVKEMTDAIKRGEFNIQDRINLLTKKGIIEKDKFYNPYDLAKILGITPNKKEVDNITQLFTVGKKGPYQKGIRGGEDIPFEQSERRNVFKYRPEDVAGNIQKFGEKKSIRGEGNQAAAARRELEKEIDPEFVKYKENFKTRRNILLNSEHPDFLEIASKRNVDAGLNYDIGHPIALGLIAKHDFLQTPKNIKKFHSISDFTIQDNRINRKIIVGKDEAKEISKKYRTGFQTEEDKFLIELGNFLKTREGKKATQEDINFINQWNKKFKELYKEKFETVKSFVDDYKDVEPYLKGQEYTTLGFKFDLKPGQTIDADNLQLDKSYFKTDKSFGNVSSIAPNAQTFNDLTPKQKAQFHTNVINQYGDYVSSVAKASNIKGKAPAFSNEDIKDFKDTLVFGTNENKGLIDYKNLMYGVGTPFAVGVGVNASGYGDQVNKEILNIFENKPVTEAGIISGVKEVVQENPIISGTVAATSPLAVPKVRQKALELGKRGLSFLGDIALPAVVGLEGYRMGEDFEKGVPFSESLSGVMLMDEPIRRQDILNRMGDDARLLVRQTKGMMPENGLDKLSMEEIDKFYSGLNLKPDLNLIQKYKDASIAQEAERAVVAKEREAKLQEIREAFPEQKEIPDVYATGGRVKFAEGSNDPESDLYIPPLETPETKKDGVEGLYFDLRKEQRMVPLDETGKPITSGGIRELKKVFSSMLYDSKPEIGYGTEKFNISASKGINPFQGDRDIRYQATYTPEGDVGKFMIGKTPQALGAGYSYQKDGLDLGITGLKDQMGDKSIMLRFGYNYNNGGRVGFSSGGIKLARLISEALLDLKNNIHMVGNTARFKGAKEAKLEALTPYKNVPDQSRHTSILESINKAKQNLPKEYQSILDDIKKDVDNFDYATADNRIMALDKEVNPTIRFEGLSKDLFPMEDPLNNAIIILDPNRDRMIGRFVNRVRVDTKTGRGIRETYDTFDSESRKFLDEKDWKLMGVESLEKGKEGLN